MLPAHRITGDQLEIGDGFWQAILPIFDVIDEFRVTMELEKSSLRQLINDYCSSLQSSLS
jgi:hypothetical protein